MERKKIDNLLAYLYYTLGFAVLASIIAVILYYNNKSIVYMGDALVQQYPTQFYLTKMFSGIMNGIKTFNFNIGLGQDTLLTYHYYGMTDPINLLLGVFSWVNQDILYYCGIGIRMYIAGMAFIAMCIHFKKNKKAMVIGAFIYVFSNFCLSAGIMYPYFINTMIYLPLMIVGVDKLIKDNKIAMFIIISVLSIIVNIYMAYMIAVITLIYAIITVISEAKNNGFIASAKIFGRGFLSYVLAAAISGIVVVPIAYAIIMGMGNTGVSYNLPVFSGENDIFKYFIEMFQIPDVEKFTLVGISIITLFSMISLFSNRCKMKLKIISVIMLLVITMPIFQSIVAGTMYGNHRWYFAEILILSYIFVDQYNNILKVSGVKKAIMYILVIAYLAFITYINVVHNLNMKINYRDFEFWRPIVVTIIGIIFMLVLLVRKKKLKKYLLIASIFISIAANMVIYAYEAGNNNMLADLSYLNRLVDDRTTKAIANASNETLERVDNENPASLNLSDIYDYPSTSIYYGLENRNLSKFNLMYRNAMASPINRMHNLDGRTILDNIMSVKYYIGWKNNKPPYGFENMGPKNLYVNKNYIPFGFTYSNYIMPYEVASMSVLDMQEALLKACLIEENIGEVKHLDSGVLSDLKLKKTDIEYKSNVEGRVKGSGGLDVKLEYELPYSGELYLKLPDIDAIKGVEKLNIKSNSKKSTIDLTKPSSQWYVGEKDIVINLGYFEKGKRTLEINLPAGYDFNMNDLKLECRPVDIIEAESKELAKEHLTDLKLQHNGFTGNISNTGNKLMFISIPYDEGWTAVIDGMKTKIYKANEGFMAVKLDPGEHTVEFKYKRPMQTLGYVVSVLGIAGLIVYSRKRKKKNYVEDDEFYEDDDVEDEEIEELEDNTDNE